MWLAMSAVSAHIISATRTPEFHGLNNACIRGIMHELHMSASKCAFKSAPSHSFPSLCEAALRSLGAGQHALDSALRSACEFSKRRFKIHAITVHTRMSASSAVWHDLAVKQNHLAARPKLTYCIARYTSPMFVQILLFLPPSRGRTASRCIPALQCCSRRAVSHTWVNGPIISQLASQEMSQ